MAKTLQQMIDENSKAWHSADAAGRQYLEQQNKKLHSELDARNGTTSTLNTATGKWETLGGGSGAQGASAYGSGAALDGYGNVDYKKKWDDALSSGANLEYLKQIAAGRKDKVSQDGAYSGYANDSVQRDMDSYLYQKELEYKQQQQQQAERRMIESEIGRVVNGLEGQKYGINQNADELARQAYIKNMQSKRTMPQELSAAGYSGGMADSQKLALELGLRSEQADIANNRSSALNGVDTAINDAQLQGSIEGARAEAARAQAAIDRYNQYSMQKMQMDNTDYWKRQDMENDENRYQSGLDYDAKEKAYNNVWYFLKSGRMPPESELLRAGISVLEASAILTEYQKSVAQGTAQNTKTGGWEADAYPAEIGAANDAAESDTDGGDLGHSPGYGALLSKLSQMEDRGASGGSLSGIAFAIQKAMESGGITEGEARALYAQYGIKV